MLALHLVANCQVSGTCLQKRGKGVHKDSILFSGLNIESKPCIICMAVHLNLDIHGLREVLHKSNVVLW